MSGAPAGGDDADPGPRINRRSLGRTIAIGVAGLVLPAIGMVMLARSCSRAAVGGELIVAGDGGWRAPLARCRSGELQGFDGVELGRDSDGATVVRAIADADRGPSLELTAPGGGPPIRLTTATCPGLELEVRTRDTDREGSAILDGHVRARCPLPGGRTLRLDAWWRRCGPT